MLRSQPIKHRELSHMSNNLSKPPYRPAFAIDSLLNFSTQIVIFVLSLVSSIIIARSLGPQGKGVYSLAILIPTLIASIVSMGINSANVYFIGTKKFSINKILSNALAYSLLVGITFTLLFQLTIITYNLFSAKVIQILYFIVASPMIILLLVLDNINYTFLANRQIWHFSSVRFLRIFFYVAILVFLYLFFSFSVLKAIFANIGGLLFAIFLGFYLLNKQKYITKPRLNLQVFKEVIKFGYKQHLGSVFQLLNYRVDMLIVVALLSESELGLYSISVVIAETVWYLPNAIGQILFAKVASETDESANKFTPLVCRTIIIIIILGCLMLYALADILIPLLFTSSFSASILPLKLLLPGILFLSISKIIGSDLSGRGFPHYSSIASGVALIVTVVFDLLFIPIFGINGAALASSISYMVNAAVVLYFFKKTSGISINDILIIKASDFFEYKKIFISFKPSF